DHPGDRTQAAVGLDPGIRPSRWAHGSKIGFGEKVLESRPPWLGCGSAGGQWAVSFPADAQKGPGHCPAGLPMMAPWPPPPAHGEAPRRAPAGPGLPSTENRRDLAGTLAVATVAIVAGLWAADGGVTDLAGGWAA